MKHKQDRHNCSLLLNLKLFLSNLSEWRINISGNHLPINSSITWHPPPPERQKLGEDVKDVICKYYGKESNSNIAELLVKQNQLKGHDQNTSKRRVSYFVSSMKKRRRERSYNIMETNESALNSYKEVDQGRALESSTDMGQLRQLSDQQIIDVLKDDTDGPTISYVTVDPGYTGSHGPQCHLQSTSIEFVCEGQELILDTGHQHVVQQPSIQYVHVNSEEVGVSHYQTVSGEPSVLLTLDSDQSKQYHGNNK